MIPKGSRVQEAEGSRSKGSKVPRGRGFKESSEMLKNYKDLKVWQKSYELRLEI